MSQPKPRANPALRLAFIRRIHTYLGLFIAPSLLFFAVTGGLQLYGLHEPHEGYKPPALVEKLGMVHKDQVFKLKAKKKPAASAKPTAATADEHEHEHEHEHDADHAAKTGPGSAAMLKALFLVVAVSLAVSTLLGVWMALAQARDRKVGWGLLIAGTALPILLIALSA